MRPLPSPAATMNSAFQILFAPTMRARCAASLLRLHHRIERHDEHAGGERDGEEIHAIRASRGARTGTASRSGKPPRAVWRPPANHRSNGEQRHAEAASGTSRTVISPRKSRPASIAPAPMPSELSVRKKVTT